MVRLAQQKLEPIDADAQFVRALELVQLLHGALRWLRAAISTAVAFFVREDAGERQ